MMMLRQDLRYGLRMLVKSPGFTFIAILAMALGIGANTAIFSVVNAVLLRQLPYKDPGRLAMVWQDNRRLGLHEDLPSYTNFDDWRSQNHVFEDMAAFTPALLTLSGDGEPEQVEGAFVPSNLLPILGVRPMLGRNFSAEEEQEGRNRVAILSYGLWKRRFGGDPNVVGGTLEVDGSRRTVIGVMPQRFGFPSKGTELWAPLTVSPQRKAARGNFWLRVVGRLKQDVSLAQARAEMDAIGARLEQQYPRINAGLGVYVVSLLTQLAGSLRPALLVLFGAVVFVLLIACANVANLLLARAVSREREMAIRAALGAGSARIIRQLLTESTLLSLLAGAAGLLLGHVGIKALIAFGPRDMPRLDEVRIDLPVLGFTLSISLVTGILFGLAPALKAAGSMQRAVGRARMRGLLVIAETAMAVVLLAGAGLMIRSFLRLRAVDPGFHPEGVLTMQLDVPRSKYPEGPQVVALYEQILRRLGAMPGIQSVGAISDIFLSKTPNSGGFTVEGKPPVPLEQQIEATIDAITPGYFQAMGAPLQKGRFFTSQDGRDTPRVVIINDTMARRFWPDEDPVGKRFKFGGPDSRQPWLTVVGVVGDMRRQGLESLARSETFLPHAQLPWRSLNLVIRTSSEPLALASAVRAEIRALDKDSPIRGITTIEDLLGESVSQRRFQMLLLALFSLVALALAAVGIYGVIYHSVTQRTHEIGIRMALGAQQRDVLRLVLLDGVRLALLGVAAGTLAGLALTRVMAGLLYGVRVTDPVTFAGAALLLAVVAVVASYIPARRASRVEPMVALRYE